MPCSIALRATASAAICAANGVDFFEPLKPRLPAEAQAIRRTLLVGDRHDRVVERRVDVRDAGSDVLELALLARLGLLLGGQKTTPCFILPPATRGGVVASAGTAPLPRDVRSRSNRAARAAGARMRVSGSAGDNALYYRETPCGVNLSGVSPAPAGKGRRPSRRR